MAEEKNLVIADRYEVLRELGEGGFSTVYKVRDLHYGHIRALRTLKKLIINKEDKVCKNWIRECGILMRLGNGNHPNIVHYYRPDIVGGTAFVEMDYVEGRDIREYIEYQKGCVPLDEVYNMVEQISSALAICHHDIYRYCINRQEDNLKTDPNDGQKLLIDEAKERELIEKYKVIHNDIHEGNVMRQFDGRYILIDFGLAIQGEKVVKSSRHENGRPEYMAPEKSLNDTVLTEQSDIYSFGILMYQFLAGRVPFEFNSKTSLEKAIVELQEHHLKTKPESILPLRRDAFFSKYPGQEYSEEYPGWLEKIIMKCLEKKPGDRYQDGKELHEAVLRGLSENVIHATKGNDVVEVANLKNQLAQKNELNTKLQERNSQLAKEIREKDNRIEQLVNENGSANSDLKRKNADLTNQLAQKNELNTRLQERNSQLAKEIREKDGQIEQLKRSAGSNEEYEKQLAKLKASENNNLLRIRDLKQKNTELNGIIANKSEGIKNLSHAYENLLDLSNRNKALLAQANKTIDELETRLKTQGNPAEMEKLQLKVDKLKKNGVFAKVLGWLLVVAVAVIIALLSMGVDESDIQYEEIHDTVVRIEQVEDPSAKKSLIEAQASASEAQKQVSSLEQELKQARQKNESLNSELTKTKSQLKKSQAEVKNLRSIAL